MGVLRWTCGGVLPGVCVFWAGAPAKDNDSAPAGVLPYGGFV